jgi:hypothetical protein
MAKRKRKYYLAGEVGAMCGKSRQYIGQIRRKHFPHARLDETGQRYEYPRGDVREFLLSKYGIHLEDVE